MEHKTRPESEGKSYVVEIIGNKMLVTHSSWAVDYTPAHRATKKEALEYYLRKQQELADQHHLLGLQATIMLKELEIEEGLR